MSRVPWMMQPPQKKKKKKKNGVLVLLFCLLWGTVRFGIQETGQVGNGFSFLSVGEFFYDPGLNFYSCEMTYINMHQRIKKNDKLTTNAIIKWSWRRSGLVQTVLGI